jgi:hypothetical protein
MPKSVLIEFETNIEALTDYIDALRHLSKDGTPLYAALMQARSDFAALELIDVASRINVLERLVVDAPVVA